MALCNTTDDFKDKLVGKIISAESCEQVRRYVATALRSLQEHKVNPFIVSRFIDKSIITADKLKSAEGDGRISANIECAKAALEEAKTLLMKRDN